MNRSRMSKVELPILADLGKLGLFAWRSSGTKIGDLSDDLKYEYNQIMKQYDLHSVTFPYSQVGKLIKTIYKRLEHDMKTLDRHYPIESKIIKGSIVSIYCSCGELTRYKVPLKLIDDFQCPREGRV